LRLPTSSTGIDRRATIRENRSVGGPRQPAVQSSRASAAHADSRRNVSVATAALAAGAATVVALEAARGSALAPSSAWLFAECVVAAVALLVAWRFQASLAPTSLIVVAGLFQLGLAVVHLRAGIPGDTDVRDVYRRDGNALLDGTYPESAYPPGAVVLFALDALLGGGPTRTAHAFAMVPFNVLLVASIWALRTERSSWFAAVALLAPASAFYWEYRFDLVPASLLAAGLVLVRRERWLAAAAVLGVGTWVKWAPALSALGLGAWLAARGSARRVLAAFAATFMGTVLVLHLPFLVWDGAAVIDSITGQGGRGLTGESVFYIPLHALGLAELHESGAFWFEAVRPAWADPAAVAVQAAVVAAGVVTAALARTRDQAIAAAALLPAVFLLTNRIFSPQFVLVIAAAWLVAGSLLCRSDRAQLALGAAVATALFADALVYPGIVGPWLEASAGFFLVALGITAALWVAILRKGGLAVGKGPGTQAADKLSPTVR
jgi:hypothetical protein